MTDRVRCVEDPFRDYGFLPYRFAFKGNPSESFLTEVRVWCAENIPEDDRLLNYLGKGQFWFRREIDAIVFKLRWVGAQDLDR